MANKKLGEKTKASGNGHPTGKRIIKMIWKIINYAQASIFVQRRVRNLALNIGGAKIDATAIIASHCYFGSQKITVARGAVINIQCFLDGSDEIAIGESARLGPYVKILTGTHEIASSVIRRNPNDATLTAPVKIEKGCWIGMGAMILPGITIAEGCVIAAGAVVTKDTEPNGLYAGVPAKRVKNLNLSK
jgi:acetyltransferase-like isoleucine patch superfamily enzyme